MDTIKVLIVEDEFIIAETIVDAINDFGYKALEPAINYSEALSVIENEAPDIGIFDIQLSGKKTGVDLASVVQEKYKFPFIFLTSNSDKLTLDEAKVVKPAAFLVKPFNNEELYAAIELALYNYSHQKEKEVASLNKLVKKALFIKEKETLKRLNFSDILYLKSDNVYIDIYTVQGKTYTVRASLGEYINKLDDNFLRVHRGYIVNLAFLEGIGLTTVTIQSEEIPIGSKYKAELMNVIHKG